MTDDESELTRFRHGERVSCAYCGIDGGGHRPNCPEHPDLPEGWRVANLMAHELMRVFPVQMTYEDSVQAARVVADEFLKQQAQLAEARELLEACWYQFALETTVKGVLGHNDGGLSVLADVRDYLWPGSEMHRPVVSEIGK